LNHSDVHKRMADYLEGDLSLDRRAVFDAHLDACAECRAEMEELRAISHVLSRLPDVEPPPNLTSDVMRRIRLGEAAPTWGDHFRTLLYELSSPGIAIPVSAMLAAFVLAVASGQFQWSLSRDGAGPGRVESAGVRQLQTIPREAAALAQRVFRSAHDAPARQIHRGGDATLVTAQPRAYIQVLPAASGGAGTVPSEQRQVRIVVRPSFGQSFADIGQGTPRSADDWLAVMLHQPAEFARRQASLSLAEREHWVRVLARRAAETGSAQVVADALRRSGGPEALRFASAFEAEAQLTSAQLARSR